MENNPKYQKYRERGAVIQAKLYEPGDEDGWEAFNSPDRRRLAITLRDKMYVPYISNPGENDRTYILDSDWISVSWDGSKRVLSAVELEQMYEKVQ